MKRGRICHGQGCYEQVLAAGRTVGASGLIATAVERLARLVAFDSKAPDAKELLHEASAVRAGSIRPAPPLRDPESPTSGAGVR
jgi:hypothetical protein